MVLPSHAPTLMEASPDIFLSKLEIPQFSVRDRWWEEDAIVTLRAYALKPILQGFRFGFFRDMKSVKYILESRPPSVLNSFITALSNPHEPYLSEQSNCEKLTSWSWFPSAQGDLSSAQRIALEIEAESHFQFRQIAFEDIVRAALGYEAPSVEWFLQQHRALGALFLKHMRAYPKEITVYSMVEEHLRTLSPFAHQTLAQCLMVFQPDGENNMPLPDTPGFSFIAGPIQQLFKENSCSLREMFKLLSVLAARFQQTYTHSSTMSWTQDFDVSLPHISTEE
ncbi:hypothetical protein N7499_003082 [Penicillium canescens]|uniref:Uncharacterized protein n=1 Tax=Penicillium canescens TaxID=5083 RepID=A0AAD6IAK7_PENCN|nr:uncharacterized protein N7446_011955 [Penicillium canescens]KAJ6019815.1 hypothetical protein N7522_000523 [Penicillium canescens]KAJ6039110.1 hypothetical protein N7460_007142 [Penicillium canescens]KAJ6047121.1 hypothetical protein N7446_011955 [Penicillium canescens]KAJ6059873.1 hypothetical protein N7444_003512 [Penicillium canescens]KAJ6093751.1 hypothetical protein N7499_003082 [Penicillium canescens]